jgi:hypothetical protein
MSSSAPPIPDTSTIQQTYPDGRVALAEGVVLDDARFANDDLAPVPIERRTWGVYNLSPRSTRSGSARRCALPTRKASRHQVIH